MTKIQKQMVFCEPIPWLNGPDGDPERDDQEMRVEYRCLGPVDSGETGYKWGRVIVEADLPRDTGMRVYACAADTAEDGRFPGLSEALAGPESGRAIRNVFGPPVAASGDFYLKRAGRYLWLAFELTSANFARPGINKIRILMDGDHMTDYLPAIYRDRDFTYRFLSIFDSMYADMDRAIDSLPELFDYEAATGDRLRLLASWMNVEGSGSDLAIRERIRTALTDFEYMYTPKGVARSVERLTGRRPVLIEYFDVAPDRPGCHDPEAYRLLYGDDPYCFFVLLPEDTFRDQRERVKFRADMEELIPAGMTMRTVELRQCVQLGSHTYLGINSRVGGYASAALNEKVTIHYDTKIGGNKFETSFPAS